jgi:hypothetical protein
MTRRYMTRKGKHIPLRGGHVTLKRVDREMAGGTSPLKDKQVLPDGNLLGRRLGELGGQFRGKPIVPKRKGGRKGESGFGI